MLRSWRLTRLIGPSPPAIATLTERWSLQSSQLLTLQPLSPNSCDKFNSAAFASLYRFRPSHDGRDFASGSHLPHLQPSKRADHIDRTILYRGPWLLVFRLLVRFKIAQLGCVGALAIPFHSLITQGSVDGNQLAVTGALFAGCAAVSTTLWYLSRRYIGKLSLLTASHRRQLCISTLDFWGNRQDVMVELEDLVPVLNVSAEQAAVLARQSFIPLTVAGDRQYLLSLRHGQLLDKDQLFKVLKGSNYGRP